MANVQQATNFLKAHGHINHVASTEDGLIATAWERFGSFPTVRDVDHDAWYEVTEVFPVVNDTVDLSAIRAWLGY